MIPPITLETIRDILVEQLGCLPEQVTPEARFREDLGADSLDHVEIIMLLEEELATDIPDEDAEKIETVQQALDYLKANL